MTDKDMPTHPSKVHVDPDIRILEKVANLMASLDDPESAAHVRSAANIISHRKFEASRAQNALILIAIGQGDRTVGDGTLYAELRLDEFAGKDDAEFVNGIRELFRTTASAMWDLRKSSVTVMTSDEFANLAEDDDDEVDDNRLLIDRAVAHARRRARRGQ